MEALRLLSTTEHPNERDRDVNRKRLLTAESARIEISECVNPVRREACLQDPERFLKTYMQKKFRQPFGRLHTVLIDAIKDRAELGGKKAIAAPRSRGKSTIVKGMNVFLVCAELVRFIVPICATTKLAGRIYKDFRNELATNDLLKQDFPEICDPIRALDGAPQRAARQHVNSHLTHIVWTATDYVRLPRVPGDANDYLKSLGRQWSPYGGVKMTFCGLDAAFRGMNIDDDRPDYLIIDDPETRESAKSLEQIADRIEIIEKDIEGLEGQDKPLAITMVSTVQNSYCLSAQYTDIEQKPAWDGERYGWVIKWPANPDMWETYIMKRKEAQQSKDRHGLPAVAYYLENREKMDEGVELLADNFKAIYLKNGTQVVHSAIQEVYNKISDTNLAAFKTEYQNDPPIESGPQGSGLTSFIVTSRIGNYGQGEIPETTLRKTASIDLGNYKSHWVAAAWEGNAVGSIFDYGIAKTYGVDPRSDNKTIELAIIDMLERWADEIMSTINPIICLVDSGSGKGRHTAAAYEFCRRRGKPFFPSKGHATTRFRMPEKVPGLKEPFLETWAHYLVAEKVWLYNVHTEWWKPWVHQRFLTEPYNEDGSRNAGSLTLFDPNGVRNEHNLFANHIVAEGEQTINGKTTFKQFSDENHWLDAAALVCAGAGSVGVKLIEQYKPEAKQQAKQQRQTFVNQYGQPFLATERR